MMKHLYIIFFLASCFLGLAKNQSLVIIAGQDIEVDFKTEPNSNLAQLIPDFVDSEAPYQQNQTTETTVKVVLYNMLGQPVLRTKIENFAIEASNLSPGMYVAELHEIETDKRETKKVMVK